MKICLVHYDLVYPKPSMLNAYLEVIESYAWGFASLDYDCERRVNYFDPEALNIVFGFSVPWRLGLIDTFPANTIFFDMERFTGVPLINTNVHYLASKYQL